MVSSAPRTMPLFISCLPRNDPAPLSKRSSRRIPYTERTVQIIYELGRAGDRIPDVLSPGAEHANSSRYGGNTVSPHATLQGTHVFVRGFHGPVRSRFGRHGPLESAGGDQRVPSRALGGITLGASLVFSRVRRDQTGQVERTGFNHSMDESARADLSVSEEVQRLGGRMDR